MTQSPTPQLDAVPQSLTRLPQWVCWKYVERDGKQTKFPINPATGAAADSTDPATWTTFAQAAATCGTDSVAGVGFVFTPDAGLCGVDLDDSVDPATAVLTPWAKKIVDALDSYTEVSPSGHGVKVFLRGRKLGPRCRKRIEDGEIEVYESGRFFTVTGQRLDGPGADVGDRQGALEAVYAEVFGKPPTSPIPAATAATRPTEAAPSPQGPPGLTDDQILRKASRSRKNGAKFTALWAGRWNDFFNSASEADSSVIFSLAFYTKDPAQLDRLFRQSGLMREKWDEYHGEQTYGQITIAKALEMVTGQWRPRGKAKRKAASAPAPASAATPAPGASPPTCTKPGQPQIIVDDIQLADITAQGLAALGRANSPPSLFVRSGRPSRVVRDEDGLPSVEEIDRARMRARLAEVAGFFSVGKQEQLLAVNPPLYLAENILAQGTWDFPPLLGIARSPILRPDGSICTTPGYDAASRLYYCPDPNLALPPIPERPTGEQVMEALGLLLDLVAEFPFADPASRANALGILMSLLIRPMITGHVPLAIVDAPVQGTGKTLMVTALGLVAVGTVSGESIPDKQNDDEWRKKITSVLLKGPPLVLLDNIPDNTTICAPPLAALLTTYLWSDRLLGKNDNVQLPARPIWVATGNNLRVAGDMPRRCYTVRMDANCEQPWRRSGFSHADLEQYATTHRGELLAAAFTVIRAWFAAGKPKADVPAFGSFQEWANTVGGVLAHVGVEGFLANLEDVRAIQDEDTLQWQAFFAAWWEHFGDRAVTADDLAQRILAHHNLSDEPLPEPLLVNKDRGEGSLKRSIGRNLSRLTGRIFDARKLCAAGADTHRKVRAWRLRSPKSAFSEVANPANPAVFEANPATNPACEIEQ